MAIATLTTGMTFAFVGCGRDASPVVATAASTAATNADSPVAIADRFVAAWRARDLSTVRALSTATGADQAAATAVPDAGTKLVGRGCVAADQIPGTSLVAASTICVYLRPFQGELRVGLVRSGDAWSVVGIELS